MSLSEHLHTSKRPRCRGCACAGSLSADSLSADPALAHLRMRPVHVRSCHHIGCHPLHIASTLPLHHPSLAISTWSTRAGSLQSRCICCSCTFPAPRPPGGLYSDN